MLVVVAAALMFLMVGSGPSLRGLVFAAGVTAFASVVPEVLLYNTGQKRRQVIQQALPDILDQLSIAVEAGLGFEAALQQTARNSKGPLPEELTRTLQDIQVGQPRRVAYLALGARTPVQDLQRFVRAIVQADEHGVSIARVLSTQAREMRIKAPPAGRREGDADPGQGDLPADPVHPAGAVHHRAGTGRDQHLRDLLRSVTYPGHRVPVA
ncbi:MAG: type II secretion system F family protein [Actinomycetota bacterium]|nr:type II secretion system F family protein [Actinomycetota bacterium]